VMGAHLGLKREREGQRGMEWPEGMGIRRLSLNGMYWGIVILHREGQKTGGR